MKLQDMTVTIEEPVTYTAAQYYLKAGGPKISEAEMDGRLEHTIDRYAQNLEVIGLLNGKEVDGKDESLWYIWVDGVTASPVTTADFTYVRNPYRIFLRKKEKYRYVSDGRKSRGREGQFTFLQDGTIYEYTEPYEFFCERFWFDREEVTE
jgi:hypothetical protein